MKVVAKVIRKITQAVTKAFTTVFGKTVGKFLAGIVNSPFNFMGNSAHLIGEGDWKGLMKYWAITAIQVAIQVALAVIPGVGQVIGTAMKYLGNFIQAIGASFIRFAVSQIGQGLIGSLVHAAGSFLIHAGASVTGLGLRLAAGSGSFFKDLKARGFDAVKDNFRNPLDLRPKTSYGAQLPANARITYTPSSSEVFLSLIEDPAKIPVPVGTKTATIDLLLEVVMDTAQSAAVGAIENQVERLFSSESNALPITRAPPQLEARGVRAPRPNLPYFDGNTLTNPTSGKPWMSLNGNCAFAYDEKGVPKSYQRSDAPYPQKLQRLNDDTYRSIGDGGRIEEFRRDPVTHEIQATGPSSFDQFSAKATEFLSRTRENLSEFGRSLRKKYFPTNEERFLDALSAIYSGKAQYEQYPFGRPYSTPSLSELPYRGSAFQDPNGISFSYWKPVPGYPIEVNKDFFEIAAHFNAAYVGGGDFYGAGKLAQFQYTAEVRDGLGRVLASRNVTGIRHGLTAYNALLISASETYRSGAGIHYVFVQRKGNEYRWWMMTYVPFTDETGRRSFTKGQVEEESKAKQRLGIQ